MLYSMKSIRNIGGLYMTEKPKMSSVEFGALWLTYHKKGVILRMLEYFIEKASDPKAKELMSGLWEQLHKKKRLK